jgi:hypothetical protein
MSDVVWLGKFEGCWNGWEEVVWKHWQRFIWQIVDGDRLSFQGLTSGCLEVRSRASVANLFALVYVSSIVRLAPMKYFSFLQRLCSTMVIEILI